MFPGGWTPRRLMVVAGLAGAGALVLALLASPVGPLGVLLAGAGVFFGARAAYPRIRRALAEEQRRQHEVQARAEQQHRWASRGDLRGVYGADGAELMETLLPKPELSPPGEDAAVATVVHTDAELRALLSEKLPCWRYAAFVSVLVQRRAAVQSRLRDARMGYATADGHTIGTDVETGLFFTERVSDLSDIIHRVDDFLLSPAFQQVFGDPHDENSADADGIVHAANRLMDYHDRLLELAERCRGVSVPHGCRDLQRDVGLLTVLPLEGFHTFIETFIGRVAEMADVARYATGDVQLDPVELGVKDDDEVLSRVFARLREIAGSA